MQEPAPSHAAAPPRKRRPKNVRRTALLGAMFLMATSAIGPTVAFVTVCAVIYLFLGQAPQTLLIFAGAFNGLILPIGFAVLLWVAIRRKDLLRGYRYPLWLIVIGVVVWVVTVFLAVLSFQPAIDLMLGA